jgi:hypothetical protein
MQFIPQYQIYSVEADDVPGDSEVVTYVHRKPTDLPHAPRARGWPLYLRLLQVSAMDDHWYSD